MFICVMLHASVIVHILACVSDVHLMKDLKLSPLEALKRQNICPSGFQVMLSGFMHSDVKHTHKLHFSVKLSAESVNSLFSCTYSDTFTMAAYTRVKF